MAQDKTDKTDKTPAATSATQAAQGRTARDAAYREAVLVAISAIETAKANPMYNLEAALLAKLEAGQALRPDEVKTLRAAMEKPVRGRGRPKGSRAVAERWAVFNALDATDGILPKYGSSSAPDRLSQAAAIAEAMRSAGYRRFATPEAVAAEMRRAPRWKRELLSGLQKQWQNFAPKYEGFMRRWASLSDKK